MSQNQNTSSISYATLKKKNSKVNKTVKRKKHRVNWHEAASCAIQIELQDYAELLEYQSEYNLGKNSYRIDLLVIKKLTNQSIPKNIALIFRTFNLFEIKGIGSSASIDSYYKTIGYAGLLVSQACVKHPHAPQKIFSDKKTYSSLDISLTLLSCHYPRKLIKHLREERKIVVEKSSPGVYHINKETFTAQIIVTSKLPPEENLYLHCLTNKLQDKGLINCLADDYKLHQEQDTYIRYMHQLTTANIKLKGDTPMVCEGILNLCGTSSEEIIERTRREDEDYYMPRINYLKSLLEQNNIPFDLDNAT